MVEKMTDVDFASGFGVVYVFRPEEYRVLLAEHCPWNVSLYGGEVRHCFFSFGQVPEAEEMIEVAGLEIIDYRNN